MICQIEGTIRRLLENRVELDIGSITYEVLVPSRAYQELCRHPVDQPLRLYTLEYLDGAMTGQPVPRLVGFLSEADREFFNLLRTVKNVGVRTALSAMMLPVNHFARIIEAEDINSLKTLPEIGPATAKRIVAELKGKLTRFQLVEEDEFHEIQGTALDNYKREAIEVLSQLGKKRADAEQWVQKVSDENPEIRASEDLLTEIFRVYGSK